MAWFFNELGYRVLSSLTRLLLTILLNFLKRCKIFNKRSETTSKLNVILQAITDKSPYIAHRGGIPENTITGFHKSKLGGANAVEVDLQFSKDGHPVLFHDWTVDRVSNGSGYLYDMTLKEIQSLDVGYKYGHKGATVPTLYEAIDTLKELDMYMFLELKIGEEKAVSTVTKLFSNDPTLYDRIIVISFFPHLLYKIKQIDSGIVTGLVIRKTVLTIDPTGEFKFNYKWKYLLVSAIEKVMGRILDSFVWRLLGVNLILPHKVDVIENRINVEYFNAQSIRLVTWTVNSDEDKEYFGKVLQLPFMTDYVNSTEM